MTLSLIWQVLFYIWFAFEIVIGVVTRTRHSSGNVRDRGTLRLLWIVIMLSISTAIWIGATVSADLFGAPSWLKPVSLTILAIGLLLRVSAVLYLGKSFSSNVAIHSTQTVLKTGLYRWMRHPSYTGMIIIFFAIGLHTRNWISLIIVTVPTTAALLYRIHVEEIALREAFGPDYIEYCRKTSRLIPGIY